MFTAGPQHGYRFALVAAISLSLLVLDSRFAQVDMLRQAISYLVSPVQSLVTFPSEVIHWSSTTFAERDQLIEENRTLNNQISVLQQKMQKLAVLEAENDRLRRLLDASARIESSFMTTEMISVDPDPYSIQVIINRGASDGAYVGQAILDAEGLFGMITQVNSMTSRVVLVADANIAVPVYVNRNGMRSVVIGTGDLNNLELEYVPDTADIVVGDVLVTSGLAGRYPEGYPVAMVVAKEHDPGEPFARIRAKPLAQLNKSKNLLMVFQKEVAQ
ncbi:rod shape-determining protein MreC [Reinekea marina]|uniref:Cell shape-determining protein MreC n=1 Tax=Reinekea marina TaxID=1310421 RepID=A0ABV7WWK1_9GAMM|nr:rod shape-determining protein MreC [Reinekea marina]MBU2863108.1 rod shape-determining protein MreC [Reinekea forsetii]MDN3650192.1 rod shape-determining protein MreC [Reinekea marina]